MKGSPSSALRRKKHIATELVNYSFILPAFLFLIVFMAYPVLYNIQLSFYDVGIANLISGDALFIGFSNFITVFNDPYFARATYNTAIFMVFCLSFQFIFGMALALFYNMNFKGAKWMRAIVLVGWMNPVIITGSIFKWLLSGDSGVLNYVLMSIGFISEPILFLSDPTTGIISIIAINVWIGIPFNMILLLAGMQGLPGDIYEAADIDGANRWQKFTKITLPLLRPTISILLMLGVIYTFKVFDLIYILTKGGPARTTQILPYYSYELSFQNYDFGEGAAASVIIFVFIMILASVYLKSTGKEGN